jgi:hypothetical protein
MHSVDITEKTVPVEHEKFKLVSSNKYPLCILGYEIKTHFDQKYLTIDKKFKSTDIVHFTKLPSVTPIFLRGIIFTPNNKLSSLIDDLIEYRETSFKAITKNTYTKYINKYKLDSEHTLNCLQDGIYPLDSEFLSDVTKDKNILSTLYKDMMRDTYIPSYLKLRYYKIFILLDSGIKYYRP